MEDRFFAGNVVWYLGDGTGPDLRIVPIVSIPEGQEHRRLICDRVEPAVTIRLADLRGLSIPKLWLRCNVLGDADFAELMTAEPIIMGTPVRWLQDHQERRWGVVVSASFKTANGAPAVEVAFAPPHARLRSVNLGDLK